MASENPTGFLTVQVGAFGRTTRATRERTVRQIDISNCPVTRWHVMSHDGDDKLDGHSFSADQRLQVWITEAKPGELLWEEVPEKIGALSTDGMHANIFLQPEAFAYFWAAAETTSGSTHIMELVLKPEPDYPDGIDEDDQPTFSVTNVGLFENMPGSPVHPVVAELRVMRKKLSGIATSIIVSLLIALVLLTLFRHF